MIIFNQPLFLTIFGKNRSTRRPISASFLSRFRILYWPLDAAEKLEKPDSAQKRRFIKPNKTAFSERQNL